MRAFRKVQTEYCVVLDDDARIGNGWFKEVLSYLGDGVAAVSGRSLLRGFGVGWDSALNKFRVKLGSKRLAAGDRGSTVNVLFRTSAVRDWEPSRVDVCAWEDYEIAQHIIQKGLTWLEVPTNCFHILSWMKFFMAYRYTKAMKKVLPPARLVKLILKLSGGIPYFIIRSLITRNRSYLFIAVQNFFTVLGVFR